MRARPWDQKNRELYDLRDDPRELENVVLDNRNEARMFEELLLEHIRRERVARRTSEIVQKLRQEFHRNNK